MRAHGALGSLELSVLRACALPGHCLGFREFGGTLRVRVMGAGWWGGPGRLVCNLGPARANKMPKKFYLHPLP